MLKPAQRRLTLSIWAWNLSPVRFSPSWTRPIIIHWLFPQCKISPGWCRPAHWNRFVFLNGLMVIYAGHNGAWHFHMIVHSKLGDVITIVIKLLQRRIGKKISEGLLFAYGIYEKKGKMSGRTPFLVSNSFLSSDSLVKRSALVRNVSAVWERVRSAGKGNQMAFLICHWSALWVIHFMGLSLLCGRLWRKASLAAVRLHQSQANTVVPLICPPPEKEQHVLYLLHLVMFKLEVT